MKLSTPAKLKQEKEFIVRRTTPKLKVSVSGVEFIALKNVYATSTDTELISDVVKININQTFVEIGCGTGAVSLLVARRAKSGIGVDINPDAVKNAKYNQKMLEIRNVKFLISDVFDNVKGKFDVIICNPPFSHYHPNDVVEMMFWDGENRMKKKFFKQASEHLKSEGLIYFGYADFVDIDQNFPIEEAKKTGLVLVKKYSRKHNGGTSTFFVYCFKTA